MAIYDGNKMAHEHLFEIAKHCAQAALKSPQVTGRLELKMAILTGEDILPCVEVMEEIDKLGLSGGFKMGQVYRTALDKGESIVLLLIGADISTPVPGWDCGACGFETCGEMLSYKNEIPPLPIFIQGPVCQWINLDWGIACDWAAAAAQTYNIENRVCWQEGYICRNLGYMEGCNAVTAIPLGPCKDYWWWNRIGVASDFSYEEWIKNVMVQYPHVFQGFIAVGQEGRIRMKAKDKWWEPERTYLKVVEDPEFEEKRMATQMKLGEFIGKKRAEVEAKLRKGTSK